MTLYGDFLRDDHRRTHKWFQYFPAYERHLERFRNRHVTLLEIGLGEGGSMQMWRRYLGPFARIVGIDNVPTTRQYEQEEQLYVRVGSQDDRSFLASVVEEFGRPDIVIDDGSHLQHHINASFEVLYPRVAKNGVYIVEDLHAAYWPDHGGGLRHPDSFIERAKAYVDEMHATHSRGALPRTALGDRTTSIHFYDSITVFEVGEYREMQHGITGDAALFCHDWSPVPEKQVPAGTLEHPAAPDSQAAELLRMSRFEMDQLRAANRELQTAIRAIRTSSSWRVTGPLRKAARLLRR